jgi:GNAT superfamily N-acetyltransferase
VPAGSIAIREAVAADAAAIAELLAELGYPCTGEAVAPRLDQLNSPADRVFVAVVADRPIGLLALHTMHLLHLGGLWCRITALVVAHDHRRSGVGAALLDHAEHFARQLDAAGIEVTCSERREPAHRFYTRHGFTERPKRFVKSLK